MSRPISASSGGSSGGGGMVGVLAGSPISLMSPSMPAAAPEVAGVGADGESCPQASRSAEIRPHPIYDDVRFLNIM
jgi:hypothetical protein